MPGRTPDSFPGVRLDEGIVLDPGPPPTQEGEIRYVSGAFALYDASGSYDPRSGSGGISEPEHEALDTLAHFIADDSYDEVTYVGQPARIISVITWDSVAKLFKVKEQLYDYTGTRVTEIINVQYDSIGQPVYALTESISYVYPSGSNNKVASITRTRNEY